MINQSKASKGWFIAYDTVVGFLSVDEVEGLPLVLSGFDCRCAVCGMRGAELHHWAPKYLFSSESESWPKDYLCKKHHDQWHLKLTPEIKGGANGPA